MGSKLSSSHGNAIVVTNDKVAVTTGVFAGQFISLEDWNILSCVAEKTPVIELADPVRAIGTKMKWTFSPSTYRIAIQTAKGVLQVKSVTDCSPEYHDAECTCTPCRELAMTPPAPWARRPLKKTLFETEAAWRASLPQGGEVSVEDAVDKKLAPLSSTTDAEKVEELCNRFSVDALIFEVSSTLERIEDMKAELARYDYDLQQFKTSPALFDPKYGKKLAGLCTHYTKWIKIMSDKAATSSAEENNKHSYGYKYARRARLFVLSHDGIKMPIWSSRDVRRVSQMRDTPLELSIFHNGKLYKNFEELGVAKPVISVLYRNKTIDLSHLL